MVEPAVMPSGAELGAREPAGRELASAVGHVLSAEHPERQHLFRRQLGPELRREVPADRFGAVIHVAALHLVVDDDFPLHSIRPKRVAGAPSDFIRRTAASTCILCRNWRSGCVLEYSS